MPVLKDRNYWMKCEENNWLRAENERLREAIWIAEQYLYNPFEPDNQSETYKKFKAAIGDIPRARDLLNGDRNDT